MDTNYGSYLANIWQHALNMQSNFHYLFAYFSAFELYVAYTGNTIKISAQQSFIRQKFDEVLFFFRGSSGNQPAPGPAFWSRTPLARFLPLSLHHDHLSIREVSNLSGGGVISTTAHTAVLTDRVHYPDSKRYHAWPLFNVDDLAHLSSSFLPFLSARPHSILGVIPLSSDYWYCSYLSKTRPTTPLYSGCTFQLSLLFWFMNTELMHY